MTKIEPLLHKVQKAARYTGDELNSVMKDAAQVTTRFAFCFPDVYEIGMSHLGMKILYHLLNERDDTWVERVFAPWEDMETEMRRAGVPLFALESRDAVSEFDFVGFTLQYEMSYSNILNMLELADIPLRSEERNEGMPFVCAGGPCAFNPEPLADFVDFFLLGEGEEIWPEVLDIFAQWKASGAPRQAFLEQIAGVQGIYIPAFYDVQWDEQGNFAGLTPNRPGVPETVQKRIIRDLDHVYFPDKLVVPYMEIVHDRVMLEVFRGCIRGCRFCQAGMIYRPVREKDSTTLCNYAEKLISATGYDEISLASLSTSDYTQLPDLMEGLLPFSEKEHVSLSLPSLRIDNFSLDLMEKVQKVRKSGLTFAPEAGTQRLRDVINKGITEEDLMRGARLAFEGGWSHIKLYFMIGLPTETEEDILGIADLAQKVVDTFYAVDKSKRAKFVNVTVSVSSFVPKAFTPFQWEAQDTIRTLKEKQKLLKDAIHSRHIIYNYHESYVSHLEGVFARGDRKLCRVLEQAHQLGCKYDGWDEFFVYGRWMEAFEKAGVDPMWYTARKRSFEEALPWAHIDCGVTTAFLRRECERAYAEQVTPNCREACSGCGAQQLDCMEWRKKQ
ncbi:MAG: TIGR03960 family B12-binding radical SAM protein [Clostridia bacterium]|nr:TIGR03960 family B12-binding radical SAM protein [Clostridia bacterium]